MTNVRAAARRIPGLHTAIHAVRHLRWRPRTAALDWTGKQLHVRVLSPAIEHSRLRPERKEPWTVRWLEEQVVPGDVVWDVGANIGAYTLIAAALGAHAVAVEPATPNASALAENAALNGLAKSVILLPFALAAATGLVGLDDADAHVGATHRVAAASSERLVLAFALDELLERFSLPPPTLLKLDVDGAEVDVLEGAHSTLRRAKLRSVLVEIEAELGDVVTSRLGEAGLELRARHDERAGEALRGIWYGVFERETPRS